MALALAKAWAEPLLPGSSICGYPRLGLGLYRGPAHTTRGIEGFASPYVPCHHQLHFLSLAVVDDPLPGVMINSTCTCRPHVQMLIQTHGRTPLMEDEVPGFYRARYITCEHIPNDWDIEYNCQIPRGIFSNIPQLSSPSSCFTCYSTHSENLAAFFLWSQHHTISHKWAVWHQKSSSVLSTKAQQVPDF